MDPEEFPSTAGRIAERAGLSSTRFISYHFDGKGDLMAAVVRDVIADIGEYVGTRVRPETTAAGMLRTYITSVVGFIDTHRAPMIARLWSFWPILELEKGKTYRLHLTSMDYNHGFSLQPTNINIQVIPGYEHVVKMTPTKAGTYAIVCNEYCGIGHHTMLGRIYVK